MLHKFIFKFARLASMGARRKLFKSLLEQLITKFIYN